MQLEIVTLYPIVLRLLLLQLLNATSLILLGFLKVEVVGKYLGHSLGGLCVIFSLLRVISVELRRKTFEAEGVLGTHFNPAGFTFAVVLSNDRQVASLVLDELSRYLKLETNLVLLLFLINLMIIFLIA